MALALTQPCSSSSCCGHLASELVDGDACALYFMEGKKEKKEESEEGRERGREGGQMERRRKEKEGEKKTISYTNIQRYLVQTMK